MTASEIYSQTLASLNATRATMVSPEWHAELDNGSKQDRMNASKKLLDVQAAISALAIANLSKIADKMCAQEQAIKSSTAGLTAALKQLDRVADVLSAVSTLLTVVGKIVSVV